MASVAFLSYYSGVSDRGVETFVYEISKRLSKKHKITIFQGGSVIKDSSVRTYQLKPSAKKARFVDGFFSKIYLDIQSLKILVFSLTAVPKLLRVKCDLLVPVNGGWQTVICRVISLFTRSKVLISGHAGIGADDAWNLFFRPDLFVALTTSQKLWALKLSPEVIVVKIPNGVDLSKFNPSVKPAKVQLRKPVVVCSSALVPNKRVELTIKAVAKANLSLLLLGEGQLKGPIDTLGKRLLGEKYLRLEVSYEDVEKYYAAGDIFTLVSKNEAFGTSYIEAMACNLPIVATNDDSRNEIVGDAGILTTPEDIGTYAKDLSIAVKTSYKNRPYNQALKFSWNKIALEYSRAISQLTSDQA